MNDVLTLPRVQLNDGHAMPQLGLGVWQIAEERLPDVVAAAIGAGYRSIDTAANYGNEAGVGRALRQSPVSRDALHVTTKLWNDDHGYDAALRACDASAARLGLQVIDLYLIHWPCPQRKAYVDAWRALVELRRQGRVRSIGVSNFTEEHLARIADATGILPCVNQIELHPHFQQRGLREVHARYGIVTQAWSPLGRAGCLADPVLRGIADRHGRTPAQVVLRWHLENGCVAIPKSASPVRLAENIRAFDFALTAEDHAAIASLDRADGRLGPDPATFGRRPRLPPMLRRLLRRA
ncbi:aldo/keto reductase [Methylobacterium sp. WSM2598]|uniref:aldo/keto reductase n=1 Tax=Methylobacterium sp. WSM2598 TaxID=398261 RepID=UPI00037F723F|nr:aldo/keto reductase [Methylobacterium sp. WSM2598]